MRRRAQGMEEFQAERDEYLAALIAMPSRVVKRPVNYRRRFRYEWCLMSPARDIRYGNSEYLFALQYTWAGGLRVRAGCRYYTLRQAWKHWGPRSGHHSKRVAAQAVAIIQLLLLQAHAYGLPGLPKNLKFDASLTRKKR